MMRYGIWGNLKGVFSRAAYLPRFMYESDLRGFKFNRESDRGWNFTVIVKVLNLCLKHQRASASN